MNNSERLPLVIEALGRVGLVLPKGTTPEKFVGCLHAAALTKLGRQNHAACLSLARPAGGDGAPPQVLQALALAMLDAQAGGDAGEVESLASMAHGDGLEHLLAHLRGEDDGGEEGHPAQLSTWTPYLGKRGAKKGQQVGWQNENGRVVYGSEKPGSRPQKQVASAEKAGAILGRHLSGMPLTGEHLGELAGHLSALSVPQLREWRRKLKLTFGGGRKKEQMVEAIRRFAAGDALKRKRPTPGGRKGTGPVAGGAGKPPTPEEFKPAFDAAFDKIDSAAGGYNFVGLPELRRELGVDRPAFDRFLHKLREDGHYTLRAVEGRHGISDEQRSAGVTEDGTLYGYVSRKPGWKPSVAPAAGGKPPAPARGAEAAKPEPPDDPFARAAAQAASLPPAEYGGRPKLRLTGDVGEDLYSLGEVDTSYLDSRYSAMNATGLYRGNNEVFRSLDNLFRQIKESHAGGGGWSADRIVGTMDDAAKQFEDAAAALDELGEHKLAEFYAGRGGAVAEAAKQYALTHYAWAEPTPSSTPKEGRGKPAAPTAAKPKAAAKPAAAPEPAPAIAGKKLAAAPPAGDAGKHAADPSAGHAGAGQLRAAVEDIRGRIDRGESLTRAAVGGELAKFETLPKSALDAAVRELGYRTTPGSKQEALKRIVDRLTAGAVARARADADDLTPEGPPPAAGKHAADLKKLYDVDLESLDDPATRETAFSKIQSAVNGKLAELKKLPTPEVKAVARAFGLKGDYGDKNGYLGKIHDKIIERADRYRRAADFSEGHAGAGAPSGEKPPADPKAAAGAAAPAKPAAAKPWSPDEPDDAKTDRARAVASQQPGKRGGPGSGLRGVLRDAYHRATNFREASDGLVPIPLLFKQAQRLVPNITREELLRELHSAWDQREAPEGRMEAHILNEQQKLTPEERRDWQIHAPDRDGGESTPYYYVFWHDPKPAGTAR